MDPYGTMRNFHFPDPHSLTASQRFPEVLGRSRLELSLQVTAMCGTQTIQKSYGTVVVYDVVFCKWTSLWPSSWARWKLWEQFGWLFYIILTYFDDGRQIPTLKMTSIWWKPSVFVGTTATLKPQMPRISDPAHDWGVMMRTSCCTDPHSQQFIPKITEIPGISRMLLGVWCTLHYTSSLSDGLQMDFRWVSRWSPRPGPDWLPLSEKHGQGSHPKHRASRMMWWWTFWPTEIIIWEDSRCFQRSYNII